MLNLCVFRSSVWAWVYLIQSCECPKVSICNVSLFFLHTEHPNSPSLEQDSCHGSFIACKACIHWEFRMFFSAVQITLIRETASNSDLQPLSWIHIFWIHTSARLRSEVEILIISPWKLLPLFFSIKLNCANFFNIQLTSHITVLELISYSSRKSFLRKSNGPTISRALTALWGHVTETSRTPSRFS